MSVYKNLVLKLSELRKEYKKSVIKGLEAPELRKEIYVLDKKIKTAEASISTTYSGGNYNKSLKSLKL